MSVAWNRYRSARYGARQVDDPVPCAPIAIVVANRIGAPAPAPAASASDASAPRGLEVVGRAARRVAGALERVVQRGRREVESVSIRRERAAAPGCRRRRSARASSIRSRWSSTSSAPGAIANSSASSMVAGARRWRRSTRAVAREAARARRARDRLISASARLDQRARRSRTSRGPRRLDEAVGGELLDRPPHGGAADAELVDSHRSDGSRSPGSEGAVRDLVRDQPVDPQVERLRRTRRAPPWRRVCTCGGAVGKWFLCGTVARSGRELAGDRICGATCSELPEALRDARGGGRVRRGGRRCVGACSAWSRPGTARRTTSRWRSGSRRSERRPAARRSWRCRADLLARGALRWRPVTCSWPSPRRASSAT